MRIVVAVMAVTFFILWEVLYDNWHVTNMMMAEISRLWRMTGF